MPGIEVLVDSSRLKGYIIDVLVVSRKFLRDQPELVEQVVASYLRATYSYHSKNNGMNMLLSEDARRSGTPLEADQVQAIKNGIAWANTLDNYHYFNLADSENSAIQPINASITAITDVLVNTGRLEKDPLDGRPELLYYDRILKNLQEKQFHPAQAIQSNSSQTNSPLDAAGLLQPTEGRQAAKIIDLTSQQWESLRPVGMLKAEPVSFSRGGSKLTIQARRDLTALAEKLNSWPTSYCLVQGQTRTDGDAEANLHLAGRRAEAVRAFLIENGVDGKRIRAQATTAGGGQMVTFLLGEPPY